MNQKEKEEKKGAQMHWDKERSSCANILHAWESEMGGCDSSVHNLRKGKWLGASSWAGHAARGSISD